jgi:excisionase family DNA binding protein
MSRKFWAHINSGEIWAVELNEQGQAIMACGPLDRSQVFIANLDNIEYNYDDDLPMTNPDDFRMIERTPHEEMLHRMAAEPVLRAYNDIILYDLPNRTEHENWIATAPLAEIADWAETIYRNANGMTKLLSTEQAAELCEAKPATMQKWAREKKFPHTHQVGRAWLIPAEDLQYWHRNGSRWDNEERPQ